jgi:hypothetical protein
LPKAPWKRGAAIVAIVAFAAQVGSWLVVGRNTLERRVAETLRTELLRARDRDPDGPCRPRHLVLESASTETDPVGPDAVAILASTCQQFGVQFHASPPTFDLGCSKWLCGDCLGYAQHVRFDTPILAAAGTLYLRERVAQYDMGYWYLWCFGRWVQISARLEGEY